MKRREETNFRETMSDDVEVVLAHVDERYRHTRDIPIDKDEFKIGRARENDEILAHVAISRQHCVLKRNGNGIWTIQDLSSSGTTLNGQLLPHKDARTIAIGDSIQLGSSTEFTYIFTIMEKDEPTAKKAKIVERIDINDMLMKQKTFEASQQMERQDLAEKLKAKHEEQIELKRELDKLLEDRTAASGEKEHLNKQIESLEHNIEEVKMAEMNLERLNRELSDRLDIERREFQRKLNEEKVKMQEALEASRREKELLESKMREELEKLKNDQEVECRKLTETLGEEKKAVQEKLQNEQQVFAEKLKKMSEALSKLEARAEELETNLEKEKASKAIEVVAINTVVETGETPKNNTEQTILDTIDLTVDVKSRAQSAASETTVENKSQDTYTKVGDIIDIMDEQLTCGICSELFVIAITLNCTHTFCKYCISTWMKKKKECPVCRAQITSMNRALVLDNFIDKMMDNLSAEYKQRRAEIVEERRANEAAANAPVTGKVKKGRGRGRNNNGDANRPGSSGNPPAASTSSASSDSIPLGERVAHSSDILRGESTESSSTSGSSGERSHASSAGRSSSNTTSASTDAAGGPREQYIQVNGTDSDTESDSDDADTNSLQSSSSDDDGSADTEEQSADPEDDWDDRFNHRFDPFDESWSSDLEGEGEYVEGIPDRRYGGYGSCYICGHRGHWAPGCPFR